MLTFIVLVVTGLSQRFHELDISRFIILNLGGIEMVRLVHRYCGLVFSAALVVHVAVAVEGFLFRKWPASMIFNRKDFLDAVNNMKYYFGARSRPARSDRYDYKQKFEYWGVVLGGIIMIASGFALWFPAQTTALLPGEIIPVAKALHSNEALMAFLVIALWHVYNAVFSPEVFPLDTSIFTGFISRKRMEHEPPFELARIEGREGDGSADEGGGSERGRGGGGS